MGEGGVREGSERLNRRKRWSWEEREGERSGGSEGVGGEEEMEWGGGRKKLRFRKKGSGGKE